MKVIFVSTTKIGKNIANKLLLFTITLHFGTANQIPTYRKPILSLTSRIYLVSLPLEIQGILKQTKVYHTLFYFFWKETKNRKNLFLQYVCYWDNLFRLMFVILCDSKALLFIIVYRYSEIILTAMMLLLSLNPEIWRKSVFYALSPQTQYDANTKVPK